MKEKVTTDGLVKLINLQNPVESELLQDLLRQAGIPVLARDKESGGYLKIYMGYSVFGEDLYVRQSDYGRAQEILQILNQDCAEALQAAQPEAFDDAALFDEYENEQAETHSKVYGQSAADTGREKPSWPLVLVVLAAALALWQLNF